MSVTHTNRGYRIPISLEKEIKAVSEFMGGMNTGNSQNSIHEQWLILGKREWLKLHPEAKRALRGEE